MTALFSQDTTSDESRKMTFMVRDGKRIIQFEGKRLAASSSKARYSSRWIEFTLYRTEGGTYVLHRLGVSTVFHTSTCGLVTKYGLRETYNVDLPAAPTPCEECRPSASDPLVYPELDRHWTLTTEDPEIVLRALYRPDNRGGQYLTKVAERLLDDASEVDSDIDAAYRVQYLR